MTPDKLYRWVKASERLPKEDKQYPCKWEDTNEPFTLRYHHKNGFSIHENHLPKLLWLSPIEESEQEEAKKYVKEILKTTWTAETFFKILSSKYLLIKR